MPGAAAPSPARNCCRQRGAGSAGAAREGSTASGRAAPGSHYYETARARRARPHQARPAARRPHHRPAEDVPEWFYADLGAQMIGVQVVGIYPTNPWAEVQYIAGHCQAPLVVTGDQEQTDKVLDAMANNGPGLPHLEHIFCVDMKGLRRYARPAAACRSRHLLRARRRAGARRTRRPSSGWTARSTPCAPDDVCILVYTSGTTGPPKGAMLTHRNFVYGAYAYMVARPDGRQALRVGLLPAAVPRRRAHLLHGAAPDLGGCVNFAESIDTVAINIREIAPDLLPRRAAHLGKAAAGLPVPHEGQRARCSAGFTRAWA
jgi:long-chain acyl-CoA synthetase